MDYNLLLAFIMQCIQSDIKKGNKILSYGKMADSLKTYYKRYIVKKKRFLLSKTSNKMQK